MPRPKKKTLESALKAIQEKKGTAAVYRMLAEYLERRYLSRDSEPAHAQVSCEGAPVDEAVIEEVMEDLKDRAKAIDKEVVMDLRKEL